MKAIVYHNYGPPEVLHLEDVAKPAPKDNEILVKIMATAVNSGDIRLRKANPFAIRFIFGLFRPNRNILGGVFSGEVESTGKNVKLFKAGDKVFGSSGMRFGAYAEYISLPETATLALKPNNISHDEAATIPFGGNTALFFIKKAGIKPGQKVLIYGASGAVGTSAVQLAKALGAVVTGVCGTGNVELVRGLGADRVVDYTKEDFDKDGETFDVIFDTAIKLSAGRALRSLNKKGIFIAMGMSEAFRGIWAALTSSKRIISGVTTESVEDVHFIQGLIETNRFKPVVDRTYPLERTAEAHAYVEAGQKRGNVVVTVGRELSIGINIGGR